MSNTSFFEMVNASPVLSEKWVKVAGEIVSAARELFGVHLDHDDVASITAARAATLGRHDLDDYMDELSALEKVKARNPAKSKPAKETSPQEQKSLPDARTAARNFAEARANGFKAPKGPLPIDSLTDEQKLQFLVGLPPVMAVRFRWAESGV
ncbi:hypothetical protein [Tabrizicola sp.]|uniref:hypothetical protein n=1 Tax=Tabrizicola sp. TaxID=2005166 RepID=UPI002FDD0DBC